jgi:hypothetical protein
MLLTRRRARDAGEIASRERVEKKISGGAVAAGCGGRSAVLRVGPAIAWCGDRAHDKRGRRNDTKLRDRMRCAGRAHAMTATKTDATTRATQQDVVRRRGRRRVATRDGTGRIDERFSR